MKIDNAYIARQFRLTGKLMEFHGENDFKIRSYQKMKDLIDTVDVNLVDLKLDELVAIEGVGKSSAEKIVSIQETGSFQKLDDLLEASPDGIIEMLSIPGFGPKKIAVVWKEFDTQTIDDILELCLQGKIAVLKGFAEKSQEALTSAVEFKIGCRGKFRYASAEPIAEQIVSALQKLPGEVKISETGQLRRRMDIISVLEFLVGTADTEEIRMYISDLDFLDVDDMRSGPLTWTGVHKESKAKVKIRFCETNAFDRMLMKTTGSIAHLNRTLPNNAMLADVLNSSNGHTEKEIYESQGLQYIEPEMREGTFEFDLAAKKELPTLLEMKDLKGILHNHSTYSDGKHTLRQMAEHCKELGYEYLGISDHSQTAVYASGLYEYNVKEQQEEIKILNKELAPFKVFSGIESDILHDGSLDYPDEVLASFDFIVSSVHSGLNMDINKATDRVLKAVRKP